MSLVILSRQHQHKNAKNRLSMYVCNLFSFFATDASEGELLHIRASADCASFQEKCRWSPLKIKEWSECKYTILLLQLTMLVHDNFPDPTFYISLLASDDFQDLWTLLMSGLGFIQNNDFLEGVFAMAISSALWHIQICDFVLRFPSGKNCFSFIKKNGKKY